MPKIWTANAKVTCPHGGGGKSITIPSPRLATIEGGEILLDGDQGVFDSPPCLNTPPCAGYALHSMGLNATSIKGRPVMLVSDFTQTYTGFPVTVVETHVVDDKTLPGTPPATGTVIPPEMQENDQPTVVCAPPKLLFSIAAFGSTSQPATLPFTFSLSSQFPLRWMLWQVGPPATQLDLTAGLPSQVTVVPAGALPDGTWSSPSATVSVTITGTYAATLAPGNHEFVLTAVNRRGFSKFDKGVLVVSA
jgi:hypothetical protein